MIDDDTLIYDLETHTFGMPDANKDIMRVFGCYSYKTKKPYVIINKADVQKIIKQHRVLVGFNNYKYDNDILKREGFDLKYKVIVDLRDMFIKRAGQIKIKEGMMQDLLISYSLDFITRTLSIVNNEDAKLSFDYSILNKSEWTTEEIIKIKEYTLRDIEITKKLYEWAEDYFKGFTNFIKDEDIKNKSYLTTTSAKLAYKAVCHALKWEEKYNTDERTEDDDIISGGYVAYPAGERFEGDIYCMDFNSMYPHLMMQCNLYGRKKDYKLDDIKPVWTGNNMWKIEGSYYKDELAGVGKLIKQWYNDRLKYKKEKDPREYSLKILLNILYGVLDNPAYPLVYDKIAAQDCTILGRQFILYARKIFRENGYKILYSDTDSIYLLDEFKDKNKMLGVKDKIIQNIKQTVPFPQDTFDMSIDAEFSYLFFFRGGKNE